MDTQKSPFNRNLLLILAVLYVLTIAAFSYANWAADPEFMKWWMLLTNILILSIPLVLLYGSIYVLIVGWREYSTHKQVSPRLAKIIHWSPRVATILIIFFVSLFSLDVFDMDASPIEILGGFLIHNIPSIAMLVLLIFAWNRPVVGFAAFLAAALLFFFFFVRNINSLPNIILFVLPILLIAGLFYADWQWRKPRLPAQSHTAA
jgi:hypothetical protein